MTLSSRFVSFFSATAFLAVCLIGFTGCPEKTKPARPGTGTNGNGQNSSGSGTTPENNGASENQKQLSDNELIDKIRQLGNQHSKMELFKGNQSDLFAMNFEWEKVREQVGSLYHKQFPDRPEPGGSFVVGNTDKESKTHDQAFYSHNKHFEWLVAEALTGPERKHLEFERANMAYPFYPGKLRSYYVRDGSSSPDYEKMGAAAESVFLGSGFENAEVQASNDDDRCLVVSQWTDLPTVHGIQHQQQFEHVISVGSGFISAPDRYFESEESCLRLATYVRIRRKGDSDNGHRFGPLGCTLLTVADRTADINTDLNNWSLWNVEKLNAENIPGDSLQSKPDTIYMRKLSSGNGFGAAYEVADGVQKGVTTKLQDNP